MTLMENKNGKNSISVVIPTRNRAEEVVSCMKSILTQTLKPYEVIIVDSSDSLGLKDRLKQFKTLNWKYFHTKAGMEYQRNFGIDKSSGEIILFSDDDTIWDRNYLREMLNVFEKYPKNIGAVSGSPIIKKTSLFKNFLKVSVELFNTLFLLTRIGDGKFLPSGRPTLISNAAKKITKCEFLYGFSMAFRKDVINQFRFDENLKGYPWIEDDDIAFQISRKYQNYFTPFAKILHNRVLKAREDTYLAKKKKIEYHFYFFRKNMPKDLLHKTAFWWSVAGLFIQELAESRMRRNTGAFRGLFDGLKNILKGKVSN
jgi:glycosyltransferase involved in cell wall biosynthesis